MGADKIQGMPKLYEIPSQRQPSSSWHPPLLPSDNTNTGINGSGNWGVGDGFSRSYDSNSDQTLIYGQNALNSNDTRVVEDAKGKVGPLATTPDASEVVKQPSGQVDQSKKGVDGAEDKKARATEEKTEAKTGVDESQKTQTQATEAVNATKELVALKQDAFNKADAAVTTATQELATAKATLTSATTARQNAQQAYDSADEKSKPALLAALNAAKAAEEAAQKQVDLANANLEKAEAQKEKAAAELKQAEAQLTNDEAKLQEAKNELATANERLRAAESQVTEATTALGEAQLTLNTSIAEYEKVKSDVQKKASELSKELDAVLEELKEKEKTDGQAGTGTTSTTSKKQSGWDKLNSGLTMSSQALGTIGQTANLFQQQPPNNNSSSNSTLRKPTAEDYAILNGAINSYQTFMQNGWGNEYSFNGSSFYNSKTGQVTSLDGTVQTGTTDSAGTTSSGSATANATNPFVLKKNV